MINRRHFAKTLAGTALVAGHLPLRAQQPAASPGKFEPTWDSLKQHRVPEWYNNAKLGIFIHWGLYSVPAWAPPTGELNKVDPSKWFYQNPYAEWYLNSLRLKDSPTYKHHSETYCANFDYYNFAPMFDKDVRN